MNIFENYYLGPDTTPTDPECDPRAGYDHLDGKVDSHWFFWADFYKNAVQYYLWKQ